MFTLRKQHFEDGNPICLFSTGEKLDFRNRGMREIVYELIPLGLTPNQKIACQVVRSEVSFSDSYPSLAKYTETATWERVDVRLDVQGTLTDHILNAIAPQRETFAHEDAQKSTWIAELMTSRPQTRKSFERKVRD